MRAKLQSYYFLRIFPEPGELEFLKSVIAHAGINPPPEAGPDGSIVLDEDQIRRVRMSLLNLKTGDMLQEVLLTEFWEYMPDFGIVSEERDPLNDNLPLKSTSGDRRKRSGSSMP